MTESVITEFSGKERDSISRIYHYGPVGVRVMDSHDRIRRLYRFDPSSNTMTENDPGQPQKILRRFVFDNYGMLEEMFSFGNPPRTYRYEAGGRQIVMREGGDYGAVGKTYSFEGNGVAETAFGRDGSIDRVYAFERGGGSITIRSGGWYGDVERKLVCDRIDASVFLEPEAFLQFLMFIEKSQREIDEAIDEEVAKIRGATGSEPGQNRYAYTGTRHTSQGCEDTEGIQVPGKMRHPDLRDRDPVTSRPSSRTADRDDPGIDFIPDAASSPRSVSRKVPGSANRSTAIPFEERWQSATNDREELSPGRSARIPLDERFQGSHDEDRALTKGRSASIPLDERFRSSRDEDRTLTKGGSAGIPLDERFQESENERGEKLTPGRSAQISYEERRTGKRQQ